MFEFRFEPWDDFFAMKDSDAVLRFMSRVATASEQAFRSGLAGSHSGQMGRVRRASAPGEYPANQSGRLSASITADVSETHVTVGSTVPYAAFLRNGTRRMARRKMSDDALKEGYASARSTLNGWVKWSK